MEEIRRIIEKLTEDFMKNLSKQLFRRMLVCLAAVVVFATTYGLILPAIAPDQDSGRNMPGLRLEGEAGSDTGEEHTKGTEIVPTESRQQDGSEKTSTKRQQQDDSEKFRLRAGIRMTLKRPRLRVSSRKTAPDQSIRSGLLDTVGLITRLKLS